MADALSTLSTESLTAAVTSLLQKPLPDISVHVTVAQTGTARQLFQHQQSFVQTLTTSSSPVTLSSRPQRSVPTLSYLLNQPTSAATTLIQTSVNPALDQTSAIRTNPLTIVPSLPTTVIPTLPTSVVSSSVIQTTPTTVLPNIQSSVIPTLSKANTESMPVAKKLKFSVDNLHLSSPTGIQDTLTSQSPSFDVSNSLSALQSLSTLQNILNAYSPVNVTNSVNNISSDNAKSSQIAIQNLVQNLPTQQLQQLVQSLVQQTETNIQPPAPINNAFQPISVPAPTIPMHASAINQIQSSSIQIPPEQSIPNLKPVIQTVSESPVQPPSTLPNILENQLLADQNQSIQSTEELQNLMKGNTLQQYPFIVQPSTDGGPVQLIPIGPSLDLSWLQILQKNSSASETRPAEGKSDTAPVAIQPKPPVIVDAMNLFQKDTTQSTLPAHEQGTQVSDGPIAISIQEIPTTVCNIEETVDTLGGNDNLVDEQSNTLGMTTEIQIQSEPIDSGNSYELAATEHVEEAPEDIEDVQSANTSYQEMTDTTAAPEIPSQPEPQKMNIFCTVCNKLYPDGCKVHNTEYEYIQDTPILSRARASLPACFHLQQTSTSSFKDYPGVWCKADISERTVFGPAVGNKEQIQADDYKQQTHGFNPYKLSDSEGTCEVLCLDKEEESNWMMFVRCAHSLMEQNCVLYQDNSAFCLITTTEVKAEEELLMWYSADLCEKLGISQNPENTKLFQCNHCGKYFTTKKLLGRHYKIVHPESCSQVWACPMCYKKFSSNSRLNSHMMLHMGLKPYNCSYCNKMFSDPSNLKTHMLIHTGQKKFKCETCGKTFRQKAHLDVHYIVHTGDKKYKCKYCDKPFARQADLKTHTYTHTQELFYTCTTCGKVFYKAQNYKRHLKTHTGERNYMCNKCFKGFQTKYHRDRHLKICKEKNGKESSYMSLEEVAKLGNTYEIPLKNVTLRRDGNNSEQVKSESGPEET